MLITGGAGFIGTHTAKLAIKRGWHVRVLDNLSTGLDSNAKALEAMGVDFTLGDIRDSEVVDNLVAGCEVVVNLAAQVSVPRSVEYPEENHAINIGGFARILESCQRQGVRRIITASSAAVYGTCDAFPLDEADAGQFHSPYAASKWENEQQIIGARNAGLEAIALRFFNVYGTGQRPDGAYAAVIPKFIDMVLNGQVPTIFGDGTQTRDFVHVEDVAEAIMLFATEMWKPEHEYVYNIATQTEVSLLGLLETIHSIMSTSLPNIPFHAPEFKAIRPGDIPHSVGSNARICSKTTWRPRVLFEDGLKRQLLESHRMKG